MSTTEHTPKGHKATYTIRHYPGSSLAQQITYACECGKRGRIEDGPQGCTMARAEQTHARHVNATKGTVAHV